MLFHTTAAHMEELLAESHRKIVLLDFYASWCAPCRALAPALDALSDRYEDSVSAYSLNIDTDGEVAKRYGVTVLPTVLILQNGAVAEKLDADVDADSVEACMRKFLE